MIPVEGAPRLRITFAGSTSDVLPWRFVPQQREVRIRPGETALAFYTATNKSAADIIGVATYSVTPGGVAPYFSKIQCFCFEEQRLNAGETVDMPVFFYIDPDFLNDPELRNVSTITLNYTFFSKSSLFLTLAAGLHEWQRRNTTTMASCLRCRAHRLQCTNTIVKREMRFPLHNALQEETASGL